MSKTRIQLHEEPHSGSGGDIRACISVCIYVCLLRGQMNKMPDLLAAHFLLHSQMSYEILPNQFHQLHAQAVLRGFIAPVLRSTLLCMVVKVLKHSFLMCLNESFPECRGAVSLWSWLRKPFVVSPLPYSKGYLCSSISYHTTIHPIPITCSLVPVLVSLHHTVKLYYSLFLCTSKRGTIKD